MRGSEMYQGQPKVVKGKDLGLVGEQAEKEYHFMPLPVPSNSTSSEWYNSVLHKSIGMTEEEAEFWCAVAVRGIRAKMEGKK